jgi:hypothetical protein
VRQGLNQLRIWEAGALSALLSAEAGRAVFARAGGHATLLSLFKRPDNASGEAARRMFMAIVSRGPEVAQVQSCRLLMEQGLQMLVKLITGRKPTDDSSTVSWKGRMTSASGMAYCLARISSRVVPRVGNVRCARHLAVCLPPHSPALPST